MGQPAHTTESPVAGLVAGNTAFALDVYSHLAAECENVCLSPYSVSAALAMTWAGARGDTGRQIATVLHLPSADTTQAAFAALERALEPLAHATSTTLRRAYRIWPQEGYPLLPEFRQYLAETYGAEPQPVDYGNPDDARERINRWVEERTAGRIGNLITRGGLNDLTRLVLVNAVYLKADWRNQFKSDATASEPFTLASGRQVPAHMMRQLASFGYAEDAELQALEMPYTNPDLAMVVLLPRRHDGLPAIERRLTSTVLRHIVGTLEEATVNVLLPRFRMDVRLQLDDVLRALGVTDAFDMERADLSGMDGRPQWLYLGAAVHACCLAVDEEGTEAAAATAFTTRFKSFEPQQPREFKADHPFLYLIHQRSTGNILFLGRLADPTA